MSELTEPFDEAELKDLVAGAAGDGTPLAVVGGNTRSGLGRPVEASVTVSTVGLNGMTLYEPAELVLSARAGTPLTEVEAALAAEGQRLAFEPPDYRAFYGVQGAPTIGAVAAANLSGPRRIEVGAARDSLIGVAAVTGRGDLIHSGGRVMKNVTGYDLVKFLAGSYGTLGILSEVTFKVAPLPETERTLVMTGLSPESAVGKLSAGLGSPFAVSGAAHLAHRADAPSRTCLRLEGFETSVAQRCNKLTAILGAGVEVLDEARSRGVWSEIRDLGALAAKPEQAVWRVSVKPTDGPVLATELAGSAEAVLLDWGGGLVWLTAPAEGDCGASAIRSAVARLGGHATLMRGPDAVRCDIEVFQPLDPALMALTTRLKQSFDPGGILNPGRMYKGV